MNQCIIKNISKTIIKFYEGKITRNLQNNGVPKEGFHCLFNHDISRFCFQDE